MSRSIEIPSQLSQLDQDVENGLPFNAGGVSLLDSELALSSTVDQEETTEADHLLYTLSPNHSDDQIKELSSIPIPPLCKEEIKILASKMAEHMLQDERINKFFNSHEKTLQDILSRISQILTGEQQRQHLAKLQRP